MNDVVGDDHADDIAPGARLAEPAMPGAITPLHLSIVEEHIAWPNSMFHPINEDLARGEPAEHKEHDRTARSDLGERQRLGGVV